MGRTAGQDMTSFDVTRRTATARVQKQEGKPKIHPCTHCERLFDCQFNVDQHTCEKHTNERKHSCSMCPAAFNRRWCLNRHMAMIHKIKIGPGKGNTKRKRSGTPQQPRRKKASLNRDVPADPVTPVDGMADILESQGGFGAANYTPSNNDEFDQPLAMRSAQHHQCACSICGDSFASTDAILLHLHEQHSLKSSASCPCVMCASLHRSVQAVAPFSDHHQISAGMPDEFTSATPFDGSELTSSIRDARGVEVTDPTDLDDSSFGSDMDDDFGVRSGLDIGLG